MKRFDEDPSSVDLPEDSGGNRQENPDPVDGGAPLFRRFAAGEPEAVSNATNVIGRVVGVRGYYVPFDQRPDVIQEAMTDLVRAVKTARFASDMEFLGFVRVVTYRRCVDWMRQTRKNSRIDPGVKQLVLPDDGLVDRDRHKLAAEVFTQLKKPCQEILALRVGRSLTYGQMAGLLGRSEGALRTQASYCLKQARIIVDRMRRRRKLVRLVDWRKR